MADGWFGATWRDVILVVAGLAAFVALLFVDDSACSVRITSTDTTTTTEVDRG